MAGLAAHRCPACRELILISDRGKVRSVGEARLLGTDRHGDPEVKCGCGVVSVWGKETVRTT